ncbi:MAG: hypothetical protein HY815_18410, partial [Candidatus Riflebacteria bacterium]|nr:hypothetical protein [Candidatus Riflebacteria bacterium]
MTFVAAGVFISIYQDDRPLRVRARGSLAQEPHTAVVLGDAPDGLPLVLEVERKSSVESAVLAALGYPPRDSLPHEVDRALSLMEEAVRAQARQAGLMKLDHQQVYCTACTVGTLFGDTLLARMLGAQSPLILPEDRCAQSSQAEQVAITAAVSLAEEPREVMRQLGLDRKLAVPLAEGAPSVVQAPKDPKEKALDVASARPFFAEALRSYPSARFHFLKDDAKEGEGSLRDDRAYESAVREACSIAWSVSRQDVGQSLIQVARSLGILHRSGRVHADVKPGNILVTEHGAAPFDPVLVQAGQIACAATPGWAAPEQVLARPVGPQTDVYALGLLAVSLLKAAIYG